MQRTAPDSRFHTPLAKVMAMAIGLSLVVGIVLLAFAWPTLTAKAQDIPVGIVGSAAQVEQVREQIEEKSDGALKLTEFDGRGAAVNAIEAREVYGAVILPAEAGQAPEVLTATAANASVAQLLQGIATQLQTQIDAQIRTQVEQGVAAAQEQAAETMKEALQAALAAAAAGQVPQIPAPTASAPFSIPTVEVIVTDIVPLADTDSRGTGLAVAAFPLVIGGLLGGVVLSIAVKGAARRLIGVIVYSAVAGIVLAAILQSWFGALQGSFALNAVALALAVAAISGAVTGLYGLLGYPGIPIGAVLMMFIGNPLSASAMPVEFLVRPWGTIGQFLPPGAAGTLLRELSYFPDADMTRPWAVLACWAVGGLLLTVVAIFREHRKAREAVASAEVTA